MKTFFFSIFLFFVLFFATAQTVEYTTDGRKMTVTDYLDASEKKQKEADYKEASRFMNGAALWHWERKEYDKAILYFEKSIELNEKINNEQGIIGIKNNLGMIYADLKQYEKAYQHFFLVLEERKKSKEPISIIASLINIAVITNNLKQYDKSIAYLNESLELALRMTDAEQMRSCYGMLAETYEKKGDSQNMLRYFELYKTFHEKTQKDKIKTIEATTAEIKLRAKLLEMENRIKANTILKKDTIIAEQEKELYGLSHTQKELLLTMSKREMLLKIAQHDAKIKSLELNEEKARAELQTIKQNNIRNLLVLVILSILIVATILWQKNNEKRQINRILETKKTELMHQKQEISMQADQISNQNNTLKESNLVKDRILSIIAHDVRSPLSVIVSFLELWDSGDFDAEETKELVKQLSLSTNKTVVMLENLLIWASTQMKGIRMNPISIDMHQIVEQKIALLDKIAENKKIAFVNKVENTTKAYADWNTVEIILQNLFSNAIKFTPENGFIAIDSSTDAQFVAIRITDTGVGMTEKDIEKLFHVDSHFSTKGTANEQGTGLGLLLCKEFVEKNGGKLSVTSKINEGTAFTFTLPKENRLLAKV